MRVAIVGAGALGGLIGAHLSEAGEDVVLVETNQSRVRLLSEAGLYLSKSNEGERCVRLKVVSSVGGLAPADMIFVAVKSYQTERAVHSMRPLMAPSTFVLSMQNGIGNTDKIAEIIRPDRVLCGITYHSVQHVGPNRLRYRTGIKPIQIAPFTGEITTEVTAIGEMFQRSGLATNVVESLDNVIWQKLLHNSVVNPVSALTGLTCQEILEDEDLLLFMREVCLETVSVMRALGIPIVDEEDPFRPVISSLNALGKNRPSMWQDLARSSKTEVDAINGAVVKAAEQLGLDVPHNRGLVHFIHSRESQKLLRKQGIPATIRTVGEYRRTVAVEGSRAAAHPTRRTPEGGMPVGREPLRSAARLKELVRSYYQDLQAANDDPDRQVACCSSWCPVEIVRAMGLTPYFPQNHAALIGASGQAATYIQRALAEGFPHFASSAMACDIGALLAGDSPLVSLYGVAGPPRPDLVVLSTSYGYSYLPWFEWYGRHFQIPVLSVHPPASLTEVESVDTDATVQQLHRLIAQLEQLTGRRLDMNRLAEVVELSARATTLWGEILAKAKAVPAPLTYFDALVHMAPSVGLRGTPAAVEYYEGLLAELDERIASCVAAVPGERYRLYWEGPPIWCGLRALEELGQQRGVAIVASTYCQLSVLDELDGKNPIESMARAYTSIFSNRSSRFRERFLLNRFQEYGVDGVLYHESRTLPEHSNVRCGLEASLRRTTGLQAIIIEADSHDLRLFSIDRITRKLLDFIELHEYNREHAAAETSVL